RICAEIQNKVLGGEICTESGSGQCRSAGTEREGVEGAGDLGMRTQRTRGSSVPTDKLPRPGRQHGYAPEVGMIDRSGDPIVAGKIARLSDSSYRLKVLDLFAGCGGLSLGFD